MKRLLIIMLLCGFAVLSALGQTSGRAVKKATEKKAFTVVIDAGHGGKDPGALGKISQEKKLNLDVTLAVGEMIKTNYPEVKVLYTRSTDVFLTLQERANFVNKNSADLFICIHTNSAENKTVTGAETFVLGVEKMQSNLDVAMRENAVMLLEEDQTGYEGFDPNSIDSYIMFELMQDQYIDQSLQFATLVQTEFSDKIGRADRGVRQAGFWVLHKSACPSVLVEMGFISNAEEEKYLASDKGKQEIATSIYNAFVSYKAALDKKNGVAPKMVRPETEASDVKTQTERKPKVQAEEVKPAEKPKTKAQTETPAAAKAGNICYRVQIFSTTKVLPAGDATFRGLKGCKYTQDGKYYKYTYGEESTYDAIQPLLKELRETFKDCFVVAFEGDKQIPVKEARSKQ